MPEDAPVINMVCRSNLTAQVSDLRKGVVEGTVGQRPWRCGSHQGTVRLGACIGAFTDRTARTRYSSSSVIDVHMVRQEWGYPRALVQIVARTLLGPNLIEAVPVPEVLRHAG